MIVVACVVAGAGCGGGAAGTGAGGGGGDRCGRRRRGNGQRVGGATSRESWDARRTSWSGWATTWRARTPGTTTTRTAPTRWASRWICTTRTWSALPGRAAGPTGTRTASFVNILSNSADAHGVTPMYTLYAMASIGDGNLSGLATDHVHAPVLGRRAPAVPAHRAYDKPALVHVEPDFWAYAQQMAGGSPARPARPRHEPGARMRRPHQRSGRPRALHPAAGADAGAEGGDRLSRLALGGRRRPDGRRS